MAKFFRANNGIAYLEITQQELSVYSDNARPICDDCLNSLIGRNDIILIPLLNEAYCPECGKNVLKRLHNYEADRPYAAKKERFWLDYFELKDNTTEGG